HHLREADELLDGLTLHPERRQERGDLDVGGRPRHDRLHRRGGLDAGEVTTVDEDPDRLGDDRTRHAGPFLPVKPLGALKSTAPSRDEDQTATGTLTSSRSACRTS